MLKPRALESFCAVVIQSLLSPVAGDGEKATPEASSSLWPPADSARFHRWFKEAQAQAEGRNHVDRCLATSGANRAALAADCVLSRLLDVQSLGDVDYATLYAAYDQMVGRFVDESFSYDNMRWTHPQMTADWLNAAVTQDVMPHMDMGLQESIRLVQRYRISSTSRDCSIMIAFQRIDPG